MSKKRLVDTHFWDDTYIISLTPVEKLLFLYCITNPRTNIAGIYELNLPRVSLDTGIARNVVEKIFVRFQRDGKMIHKDGWLFISNFAKHQAQNPSVIKGIERVLEDLPDKAKDLYETGCVQPVDSLYTECIQPGTPNLTKPNLTKLNLTKPNAVATASLIKISFGEFEKVKITSEEHSKLVDRLGIQMSQELIVELDTYLESTNKRYKSHYATLLAWSRRKTKEDGRNSKKIFSA